HYLVWHPGTLGTGRSGNALECGATVASAIGASLLLRCDCGDGWRGWLRWLDHHIDRPPFLVHRDGDVVRVSREVAVNSLWIAACSGRGVAFGIRLAEHAEMSGFEDLGCAHSSPPLAALVRFPVAAYFSSSSARNSAHRARYSASGK